MNDYELGEELGHGAFGTVYKGLKKSTGQLVVIKRILKSKLKNRTQILRAVKDAVIPRLLGCEHKNIVCVIGAVEDERQVLIISEYIANVKPLTKYVPDLSTREGLLEFLDVLQQLADGLAYMHGKGVSHGDIKLANILIKGAIPFYIDFDLACVFEGPSMKKYPCKKHRYGTPNYMAPEAVNREERDARQVDIYALGVVFYKLLTNHFPITRTTIEEMYLAIPTEPVQEFRSGIPPLDDLVIAMLDKRPKRPTAEQVRDTLNELIKAL